MAKNYTLNNAGNIDDVRNSIQCGWEKITIETLQDALKDEQKHRKRSSFIALIERAIIRKQREAMKGGSNG